MRPILFLSLIVGFLLPGTAFAVLQAYWYDNDGAGKESFEDNYRDVDVFSPQVYYIDSDFDLEKTDDDRTIRTAERRRIKVIPLVFQKDFNRELMSQILRDENTQEDIIDALIDEAEDEDYAGWQFDFENISPLDRDLYTAFVARAARAFDRERLELSVAVVPRTTPYNPLAPYQDWSAAYDYAALANEADYLVAMAYNDPHSLGPTGSYFYQRQVINFLATLVPQHKLQLGIPLYCSKWRVNGGYTKFGSLSHSDVEEDIEDSELLLEGYLEGFESEYSAYVVPSGNLYISWCDGERGFRKKLELARDYNLRGVSLWALGQENEDVWEAL